MILGHWNVIVLPKSFFFLRKLWKSCLSNKSGMLNGRAFQELEFKSSDWKGKHKKEERIKQVCTCLEQCSELRREFDTVRRHPCFFKCILCCLD